MNPFGGHASGGASKAAKRAVRAAVAGFGGLILVPVVVVALVIAVLASPVNQIGRWLDGLFGGGTIMVCPTGGSAIPLPTSTSGTLSYAQIEGVWVKAGGPPGIAPVMAAIAFAESSARPGNVQQGQPYSQTGWGLWQITPGNSAPQYGIDQDLLVPLTNARAAVYKYKRQGLNAWTTYTNGAYLQYLRAGMGATASDVLEEGPDALPSESVYETYINSICSDGGSPTLALSPGRQATILPDGSATAPKGAPPAVKAAINAANQIHTKPYLAVHLASLAYLWPYYDCSGSTSYVLYRAGLHSATPEVSGTLENYGDPGPGKWITIYANSDHVFMVIAGLAFNTAHYAPVIPRGSGPRWQPGATVAAQIAGDQDGGFVVRHPPGL